jgi:hypothetical protein
LKITTNSPLLAATFRKYAEARGKDLNELMLDQGRKLATQLYVETAAVAPTAAQIAADVKRQGWKIPAFFADGRMGRGTPSMWARARARGRPRKAGSAPRPPTLAMMQAFVTKWRVAHRLFVASGWLGAVSDLGGSLKATSGVITKTRGRAEVLQETNYTRITIVNDTPGILSVDAKHDVAKKAIAARIADMMVYIARKSRERAEQMFGRAA